MIDVAGLWRAPPNEASAPRARRHRRIRHLIVAVLMLILLSVSVLAALFAERFGVEESPLFNASLMFLWVLFAIAMMSVALWRLYEPCPRCGWNLQMQKREDTFPMLVMFIPSFCPNCRLDLERSEDPKPAGEPAAAGNSSAR